MLRFGEGTGVVATEERVAHLGDAAVAEVENGGGKNACHRGDPPWAAEDPEKGEDGARFLENALVFRAVFGDQEHGRQALWALSAGGEGVGGEATLESGETELALWIAGEEETDHSVAQSTDAVVENDVGSAELG